MHHKTTRAIVVLLYCFTAVVSVIPTRVLFSHDVQAQLACCCLGVCTCPPKSDAGCLAPAEPEELSESAFGDAECHPTRQDTLIWLKPLLPHVLVNSMELQLEKVRDWVMFYQKVPLELLRTPPKPPPRKA